MEVLPAHKDSLTPAQHRAVAARGNVLVMAGAGTGKTRTLVERCLDCLDRERVELDELLIVTFTEAAAAEMRQRLRKKLEDQAAAHSADEHWPRQLALFDLAQIGTLHSFCLKLVREHFYELGLDPQFVVLDEGEARQCANDALDKLFQAHYAGEDQFSLDVQNLIQIHGSGRDENIRKLVLRLHHYSQARPDAAGWLAEQVKYFFAAEPLIWQGWLREALASWREDWLPVLDNLGAPASGPAGSKTLHAGSETSAPTANSKAAELAGILSTFDRNCSRENAAEMLEQILSADGEWPAKKKTILRKPLEKIFDEAKFLFSLAHCKNGSDPLAEDWDWVRGQMTALLRLAQEFAGKYSQQKVADGVLDFHDLEQLALKLLWDFGEDRPTPTAEAWRRKLQFVFVDEYQDINAAQDKIIQALSRDEFFLPSPRPGGAREGVRGSDLDATDLLTPALSSSGGEGEAAKMLGAFAGNRFLVGDMKQSIYRFRLADPKIFRDYAHAWRPPAGETIALSENFRSREGLLNFVNSVCGLIVREEVGGVGYYPEAELVFGSPETRAELRSANDRSTRVELLLRRKAGRDETSEDADGELTGLDEAQKEARLVALRLKQLAADQHEIWDEKAGALRPVEWRDMTILLRSPRGKSEIYVQEFERADIPLAFARVGFYQSAEILDLLSLLQLLDNPLQDVPCIAVLRSPLVGMSLDELAEIRLAAKGHFWTALVRSQHSEAGIQKETTAKISLFLDRFSRWRKLAKQNSLSQCMEAVLDETLYVDWLRVQPRGMQRAANVAALLNLAQQFDQLQRQGLFRFLKFVEAQQEAETEPEVPATPEGNAVRLMSIHQSKGLEFPVVVLADLAKKFNEQDLRGEVIFDEELGLCPKVKPPTRGRRYPSLPHWLAQRRQRRELRGEELRLLYVALTRARDNLILTASVSEKSWGEIWSEPQQMTVHKIASATSFADWLALWFGQNVNDANSNAGETPLLRWRLVQDVELESKSSGNQGDDVQTEVVNQSEQPHIGSCREKSSPALDSAMIQALCERLSWNYPFVAATERKAKSSVTALRREAEELDDEAEQLLAPRTAAHRKNPRGKLSASEIGAAHHKFLQHVALNRTDKPALEAERLVAENYLSPEESKVLDLAALAKFWNSDLGRDICANAANVRRELPFTARFSPAEIAQISGIAADDQLENEFIVVQGVADLVVVLPDEIWLVDFKTDEVSADGLPVKIKTYTPQLRLYAAALEKTFRHKVTRTALHFLAPGRTVEV